LVLGLAGLALVIVVFNDGAYGLIRRQQLLTFGKAYGTDLQPVDYSSLAAAVGCSYFPLDGDLSEVMSEIARTPGVRLVEVCLGDVPSLARRATVRAVRENVARAMPDGALALLKRLRHR
jgi:thiamine pyrophosphate-dependent acetolactate synthase large subunit-like protein